MEFRCCIRKLLLLGVEKMFINVCIVKELVVRVGGEVEKEGSE